MPVVRRPERTVSLEPLRGGQKRAAATALSEGAGVAQAQGQAALAGAQVFDRVARIGADAYQKVVTEQRQYANETAALNYANSLSSWKARRIDGPDGAMSLKGESAFQLPEDIKAEYDTIASEGEAKASNAEQRLAFAKIRMQHYASIDLQVQRHVAQQREAYHAQVLEAHVANAVNDAVGSYNEPKDIEIHLRDATTTIQNSADRMGWGPEAVKQKTREAQNAVHLGVINNLLGEEKTVQAQTHFDAHKNEIDQTKQADVRKWLETASVRTEGQKQADAIIKKGGTYTEQLEEVKRRFDKGEINANVRDDVQGRIRQHKNDVEQAKQDTDRDNSNKAYHLIYRQGRNASMDAIPAPLLNALSGPALQALENYADDRRKEKPTETDWQVYTDLWTEAHDEPAEFLKRNLMEYRDKLSDGEYLRLTSVWGQIKSAPEKAQKELSGFGAEIAIVDGALGIYGINPNAKVGERGYTAREQLMRIVREQVEWIQKSTGKEATHQDIQNVVDKALIQKHTTPGSWWNILPYGKSFTDVQKRMLEMTIDDVPPEHRASIERKLQSQQLQYDDQTILEMYFGGVLRGQIK